MEIIRGHKYLSIVYIKIIKHVHKYIIKFLTYWFVWEKDPESTGNFKPRQDLSEMIYSGSKTFETWLFPDFLGNKWFWENGSGTQTFTLQRYFVCYVFRPASSMWRTSVLVKIHNCCVFGPTNGCSACRWLVKINFLMLKQLFAYF